MTKIIIALMGLMLSLSAHAQTAEGLKEGTNQVRLLLGASQSAFNIGAEYERRTGTFGIGGFILDSTKDSDAGKPESLTFGVSATSHLLDRNNFDIFISPGIAVTNLDQIKGSGDDDTLFGPTLNLGAIYSITPKVGVGFEYLTVFNWFSDKAHSDYRFANFVATYSF